jgi:thiol-disulfide isomerase/thioredoxin
LKSHFTHSDNCPHCKKDRRHLEEIVQEIRDNYDEIIDIGIDDFEFNSEQFIINLTALSKHPANQLDPIRLDMSKNVLPLLEEYDELMNDYESQQDDDLRDRLNEIIPEIKKELSRLLADYPANNSVMNNFKKF